MGESRWTSRALLKPAPFCIGWGGIATRIGLAVGQPTIHRMARHGARMKAIINLGLIDILLAWTLQAIQYVRCRQLCNQDIRCD
jgi:hypothetical protein